MTPPTTEEAIRKLWAELEAGDSVRQLFKRLRLTVSLRDEGQSVPNAVDLLRELENECRLFGPVSHANHLPGPERHLPELLTADGLAFLEQRFTTSQSPVVKAISSRLLWLAARKQFPKSGLWASESFECWFGDLSTRALEASSDDLCIEALNVLRGAIETARRANQSEVLARLAKGIIGFALSLSGASLGRWTLESADALVEIPNKAREGVDVSALSDCLVARAEDYRTRNSHLFRGFIEADMRLRSAFALGDRASHGLRTIALSFEADSDAAPSALHAAHSLRAAVEAFRRDPGSAADVTRALQKLEVANAKGNSELKPIEFSAPVPQGQLDDYFAVFEAASPGDVFKMLTLDVNMRVDPESVRETVDTHAKTFIFMHLFPPTLLRADGTNYTPGNEQEHKAFRMAEHARLLVELRWQMMLREHWIRLRRRGLTASTVLDHVMASNAFNEGDRPFFERFVGHWFAGDAISAVHVLVPRLEHFLRRLCRSLGRPTISVKDNGDQQSSLESALAFLMPIDPPLFFELQLVLVDQAGYAVRHTLAHGLAQADEGPYSPFMADTLLLLLIRLARLHVETRPAGEPAGE